MITIGEIAKICNVSKITASRALHPVNTHKVAVDTRQRVLRVAKQFNYRQSALVKALQTGKTMMIGFVTDNLSNHFYGEILKGLQDVMYPAGYDFLDLQWTPEVRKGDRFLQSLVDRRVDGVVIAVGNEEADYQYLIELQQHGVPVIAIDREVPIPSVNFVGSDDTGGVQQQVNYLASKGHRKIQFAYYDIQEYISTVRKRIDGFRKAVFDFKFRAYSELKLPLGEDLKTKSERFIHPNIRDYIKRSLTQPDRPTAICACTDSIAVDVIAAAQSLGLRIPDDLSVFGFSDEPIAKMISPSLTTIHQDPLKIGRISGEMMLDLIQKSESNKDFNEKKTIRILVPTRVIERETVADLKATY